MAELPFPVPNPNADFPAGNAPQHSEARASTISLYGKRKLFSPLPRPILNTLGKQWKLMDDLSRTIDGDEEEFYKRFPVVITTSASTSPISKPRQTTTLTTRDIFHGWNDKALCTNALAVSLELIIDYANRWHAARNLAGTDSRSSPLFTFLDVAFFCHLHSKHSRKERQEFIKELAFTRDHFWSLRYLLIPIYYQNPDYVTGHAALCAISPESKTIEFMCSDGDDGLKKTNMSGGIELILEFLAILLGEEPPFHQRFVPQEWRIKTGRSEMQEKDSDDCVVFTVTNAMCLIFGWDSTPLAHDKGHIAHRRKRICADLQFGGYGGWNPTQGASNIQYYPLNDVVPSRDIADGFWSLVKYPGLEEECIEEAVWARSPTYHNCPNKEALLAHCERNAEWYPGFEAQRIRRIERQSKREVSKTQKAVENKEDLSGEEDSSGRGSFIPISMDSVENLLRWVELSDSLRQRGRHKLPHQPPQKGKTKKQHKRKIPPPRSVWIPPWSNRIAPSLWDEHEDS